MMALAEPITAINHPAAVALGMSFEMKHRMKAQNTAPNTHTKLPFKNSFIISLFIVILKPPD